MSELSSLKPERVFKYFEEIAHIPHGSENMTAIANYCVDFAEKHSLKVIKDEANNVVIYKSATAGYENTEPVILQGHLDMVCQKDESTEIDFMKDGLELFVDGDFVKAKGTTLGADNGIAVAMILAILESDTIPHPPIEAVFTTDEEIGMVGALALDMSLLKGKRMINLDAEEDDTLTVSCAGGSDFRMIVPVKRKTVRGSKVIITLKGLLGGHSGVEIDKNRVNADILAGRFLNYMKSVCEFQIISIDGGDKGNAIPNNCTMILCTATPDIFMSSAIDYLDVIHGEISDREPDFIDNICVCEESEYDVIESEIKDKLIFTLLCVPDGIAQMSAEIKGLVESSSNLGILKTEEDKIILHFTLRSNKKSALQFLEDRLSAFSSCISCETECSGHYPPWEFKENSELQKLFKECYIEQYGSEPKIEAIHAGLECGVFASGIEGLDCIAMGPQLFDVHTVKERLSISSLENTFNLLLEILKRMK